MLRVPWRSPQGKWRDVCRWYLLSNIIYFCITVCLTAKQSVWHTLSIVMHFETQFCIWLIRSEVGSFDNMWQKVQISKMALHIWQPGTACVLIVFATITAQNRRAAPIPGGWVHYFAHVYTHVTLNLQPRYSELTSIQTLWPQNQLESSHRCA